MNNLRSITETRVNSVKIESLRRFQNLTPFSTSIVARFSPSTTHFFYSLTDLVSFIREPFPLPLERRARTLDALNRSFFAVLGRVGEIDTFVKITQLQKRSDFFFPN